MGNIQILNKGEFIIALSRVVYSLLYHYIHVTSALQIGSTLKARISGLIESSCVSSRLQDNDKKIYWSDNC